jgi:hypothetical protein
LRTKNVVRLVSLAWALTAPLLVSACAQSGSTGGPGFQGQVNEYIQKFPYQDTHNYAMRYTQGDPDAFNVWVLGIEPSLVIAGEDKVVRMNNDTFYKMAFLIHEGSPVVLSSSAPADDRFFSFQLMDDRNANYRNVIRPRGKYTLYHGEKPAEVRGEAIEVPSELSVVIVRVEVKDKNDPEDVAAAERVFRGITVEGPAVAHVPELDLLSGYSDEVEKEALSRIDAAFASVSFTSTVVGPGQEPGVDVPFLNFAAGTKGGWGGPDPAHSAYEVIFTDLEGAVLNGAKGAYTVTTEEPGVEAFWSITVYDTGRGGFLHPNEDDRYHINNTTAVKNADGTVTFTFKQECEEGDLNCLEVPAGPFDLAARYYLPSDAIIGERWTLPKLRLQAD